MRKGTVSPGRLGKTFNCAVCGTPFYRSPAQISGWKGDFPKTCSKACQGKAFSGEGNPYWNKTHPEHVRQKMSDAKKGKPSPKKGKPGPKASQETKNRLSIALKKRWEQNRELMLSHIPRGVNSPFYKEPELRRHRKHFSPRQRREWTGKTCSFCGSETHLVLDHIIPIFDGGTNERLNAQTLCQPCNLWKMHHVDLPRYHAALAIQRGNQLTRCSS